MTALVGLDLLLVEISGSHPDTPHSVGLIWTSDRTAAENSAGHTKELTRDISVPTAGFEPAILASELPHTHALYRAATGLGSIAVSSVKFGTVDFTDCKLIVIKGSDSTLL